MKACSASDGSGPCFAIREAVPKDAAAIQGLYRELVDDSRIDVLPEHVAALAAKPASYLLVAEAEGTVCATVLLSICADAMYGLQPFGVVENVVVTRRLRGRGLGRRLLARVEQLAVENGCTKLMLLSGRHRDDAHIFFRNCGFSGETKHAFVKYRSQFAPR